MTDNIIAPNGNGGKQGMILALAKMNAHPIVLLTMSELAGIKLTTEQGNYLRGPVMHSNSPWATDTPFWLTQNVIHARLTQIFAEGETPSRLLATPLEVTIVMNALALENPLHSEWVNVLTWAGHQAYKVYGPGGVPDSAWDDIAPKELSSYEREQFFNRIATDIRAKAVKNAPKMKGIKKHRQEDEFQPPVEYDEELYLMPQGGDGGFDPFEQ